LYGKTVLVMGGSRGIGRSMAEALAEAGARVLVTARSQHDAEQAAGQIAPSAVGVAFEPQPVRRPSSASRRRSGTGPAVSMWC